MRTEQAIDIKCVPYASEEYPWTSIFLEYHETVLLLLAKIIEFDALHESHDGTWERCATNQKHETSQQREES